MRARVSIPLLLLALLAPPLAAQGNDQSDPDVAANPAGVTVPAGWTVRADGKADASKAKIEAMGSGIHVTTGPAVILYRAGTAGKGPFHTLATFTQTKPSAHAEGYGLFVGGQGLEGTGQKYIYFLGSYLIKRRDGEKTSDISKGWVSSAAVKKPDAKGSSTNLLEIDNKVDPSKVTFKVNGQDVQSMPAAGLDLDGVVGIRTNHNLDVHVEGFDVHR
jgi:hypothetical protein